MSRLLRTTADLDQAAAAGLATLYPERLKILVGSASCGVAMGARAIEAAARRAVEELKLDATVCRDQIWPSISGVGLFGLLRL